MLQEDFGPTYVWSHMTHDIMNDPEKPSLTAPSEDTANLNEALKSKELTDEKVTLKKLKKSNRDQDKLLKDNTMMKKRLQS